MAKEHVLLSKRKYEELLASKPLVQQNKEEEDLKKMDTFTQTGNGLFVEKENDNFNGTPGTLEHSIKLNDFLLKNLKHLCQKPMIQLVGLIIFTTNS